MMVDVDDPGFLRELGRQIAREFWRGFGWGAVAALFLVIVLAVAVTIL